MQECSVMASPQIPFDEGDHKQQPWKAMQLSSDGKTYLAGNSNEKEHLSNPVSMLQQDICQADVESSPVQSSVYLHQGLNTIYAKENSFNRQRLEEIQKRLESNPICIQCNLKQQQTEIYMRCKRLYFEQTSSTLNIEKVREIYSMQFLKPKIKQELDQKHESKEQLIIYFSRTKISHLQYYILLIF
ncbi:unnamed protein product [Paramecium octaurelia]|uniref:Uncharacterized protein n=1 Tax=Paramecium octaurelia TaxID=43137 RepID=A0A8S1YQ53_PAROT|nr:unnamed protein product [Paramecium octaurelia]